VSGGSGPAVPTAEGVHWAERRWLRRLRGGRGRPLGLLLLALLLLLVWQPEVPALRLLRLASFDAYQSLAPRVRRSAPVVIVAIDEESLRRYGQWPWPRTWLARLVARVGEAQPAAIGIDILMPEPDRLSPSRLPEVVEGMDRSLMEALRAMPGNDAALARVLRSQRVVLGVAGLDAGEAAPAAALRQPPVRTFGGDPTPFVRRFAAALGSVEEISSAATGRGLISVDPERGVVRRVPLMGAVGDTLMPALGLEMLRVAAGVPAHAVRVGAGGIRAVAVGDLVVPTERDGRVWLHYTRHDPSRFVSASEVLGGRVAPDRFKDRLVLIGVTAVGLADSQATPVGDRQSSVEIHAQLLEDVYDGALLSRPALARWIEVAGLAVGGLLIVFLVPRLRARQSVLVLLALVGGLGGLGFALYLGRSVLLDAATPSLALAVLFTVMLAVTLTEAETQRRVLRRQVERQREAAARLAGELEAARRIQMGTLPRPAAAFPGERRFELYALLEPAREVGGDLYDFFPLDGDHVFFMIGDVSGKGLPGSLFMAISKALYKSTALRRHGQVASMMREADAEISRDNAEGLFVTVLAGILDARTGDLEYCSAGHEPPYLLPRGARPLRRLDEGGGPPLCAVDGFPYTAATLRLEPGDILCLITDGITEAAGRDGTRYGRHRLEAVLGGLAAARAAEVGEAIRQDVAAFTGGADPSDDMAVLVLRFVGAGRTDPSGG
jgi:adenylate cyclase